MTMETGIEERIRWYDHVAHAIIIFATVALLWMMMGCAPVEGAVQDAHDHTPGVHAPSPISDPPGFLTYAIIFLLGGGVGGGGAHTYHVSKKGGKNAS